MKIRSPIVSVLGHVDHGKTTLLDYIRGSTIADKEAGGITQHIGATEIPIDTLNEIGGDFISRLSIKDTIPGLFFVDTPGHAAFTSLRKRGGALADLAILIVDINEGFKPQTIEAINILKMYKTPFIVAANKMDRLFGWDPVEGASFTESYANQAARVKTDLDLKVYELVGLLHEHGFQSERFDRVTDFASQIAIVPISAKTGEGVIELIAMLLGLAQQYLTKQLEIHEDEPAKGTILEVKEEVGLGITVDSIIYDGVLRSGDELALMTSNDVITTNIRSILKPRPLEEIRESKNRFEKVDEVVAAAGIKISAPNLDDVVSGSPLRVVTDKEDAKSELLEELNDITVNTDDEGILVKADTLGSKVTTGLLDEIPTYAYAYSNGRSMDFGTEYITSGVVQKGQISCFQFVVNAYSQDGTITYQVDVDGENQSNPNDLSEVFREAYHNLNGQGNNLVSWSIDEFDYDGFHDSFDAPIVSIDEDFTNNNQITFNIPEDKSVQIKFTGCFIPVTVGENTLYLTNMDTSNITSYHYVSHEAKTTVMNIIPVEEIWYDHWITTQMETGAFIIPFVTKASDRLMVCGESTMTMKIEKPQAYIGCVRLPRSHYEPSSDFSNGIIKKQYKNKKYTGKSGEIDEDIDFKIKLPPREWSTLQGLCELDKPVPVNAVPTAFEGDVLNHRGWVELGAVKNVKKTNPLYYSGELELEYLTHNINTRFQLVKGVAVSKYNPSLLGTLLDYVIESGDEFVDYSHIDPETGLQVPNETGYFNLDTDGVYIYDDDEETENNKRTLITMDNNQKIIMKTIDSLKENTRINFEWFSSKIDEDRENNVTRIVRIRDKSNDIILEYEYYDYFFDYDDELYSCSVKCTKLDKSTNQMDTVIEEDDLNFAVDLEALNLKVDEFGNIVQEEEPEDEEEPEETEPTYIDPVTGEVVEIVQDAEVYNDYMYGSTLTLELAGNILSINDSGFNGREVHEEGIELEKGEYYLEVEFMNNNIDSDTPDVYHFFDFEIEEPIILTDFDDMYASLIVSSYPLMNKVFAFMRESEEGTLYYYHYDGTPYTYIQEPYYMYEWIGENWFQPINWCNLLSQI